MRNNIIKIISGLVFILFISSCVKEDYDVTPEYVTDWQANMTIKDFKALYSGTNLVIDSNIVIKGIVVSDDENGNFYKELFIQDETGAISIRLDDGYLYQKYPVGRLVYVKCEGLTLGTYNGIYQIGMGLNNDRISSSLIEDYVDISSGGVPAEPTVVNMLDLTGNKSDSLLGSFIRIENVQFENPDLTFAEDGSSYTTRNIVDCSGHTVILSTSLYADFKDETLPDGNGTIDAILSKFSGDYQLRINSPNDVNFTGSRCSK